MRLEILPITKSEHRNKYQVTLEFMHGDMDAYNKENIVVETEQEVIDIISMIKEITKNSNRPAFCDYENFKKNYLSKYDKYHQYITLNLWPADIFNSDYYAYINRVDVCYYDENGEHHEVIVII